MTLYDLYLYATRDRYTCDNAIVEDTHNKYKIGDTSQWKDGLHKKTTNGWIKVPEERDEDNDIILTINDLREVTEKYLMHPKHSLKLPPIKSKIWQDKIGDSRPLLLKKWRIERNRDGHREIKDEGAKHKDVLLNALYNPDEVLYCQPQWQPTYHANVKRANKDSKIKVETKNCVAVLDINPNNKYIEVVDWRWIRNRSVNNMRNQERKNKKQ